MPRLTDREGFKQGAIALAQSLYPDRSVEEIVRELLPRYYPEGAWTDPLVQAWINGTKELDREVALDL